MTDPHPFVRASLTRAVRALLKDKHGHVTPTELLACPECVARFWVHLATAAPKGWLGGV